MKKTENKRKRGRGWPIKNYNKKSAIIGSIVFWPYLIDLINSFLLPLLQIRQKKPPLVESKRSAPVDSIKIESKCIYPIDFVLVTCSYHVKYLFSNLFTMLTILFWPFFILLVLTTVWSDLAICRKILVRNFITLVAQILDNFFSYLKTIPLKNCCSSI